jgi:YggT family protein
MLTNAIVFLLNTLLGLMSLAFLLRFYLQATNAPFRNPLSHAVVTITDFAVIPMRRIVPSMFKLDTSTLLLAFLVQLILQFSLRFLSGFPFELAGNSIWLGLIGLSALHIANLSVDLFLYAIVAQALLSWINPHTPIAQALEALTRPILNPIRNLIPAPNGLDLSPLVAVLAAQLIQIIVFTPLEVAVSKLF